MNNSPSTIQDLSQERRAVAEAAFTNYEFGCQVSDAGQWREDENDRLTRVMTGCAEGETKRLTFHSEFFAGSATLIGVMAYDLDDGAEIGWPKGDVDKGFVSEEDDATENSARIKSIELAMQQLPDAERLSNEEMLIDLTTNLLHWAESHGLSLEDAFNTARMHFDVEASQS